MIMNWWWIQNPCLGGWLLVMGPGVLIIIDIIVIITIFTRGGFGEGNELLVSLQLAG